MAAWLDHLNHGESEIQGCKAQIMPKNNHVIYPKKPSVWRRIQAKLKSAIIEEAPPELSACEICSEMECRTKKWLNCEIRLAAAHYQQTGELTALEQLRLTHQEPAPEGFASADACCLSKAGDRRD